MEWFIIILIFAGYLLAFLLCVGALVGGIFLARKAYAGPEREKEEATVEEGTSQWKVRLKMSGGILLAIAGVGGCCFIVYSYWKILYGIFILIMVMASNQTGYMCRTPRIRIKSRRKKREK